jgi:hypothetical protein
MAHDADGTSNSVYFHRPFSAISRQPARAVAALLASLLAIIAMTSLAVHLFVGAGAPVAVYVFAARWFAARRSGG